MLVLRGQRARGASWPGACWLLAVALLLARCSATRHFAVPGVPEQLEAATSCVQLWASSLGVQQDAPGSNASSPELQLQRQWTSRRLAVRMAMMEPM